MKLSFEAKFVDCAEAIDGEILQVTFDTLPPDSDEVERRSPYVLISRNFEFPGPATVEWHDGRDYGGGAEIEASLRRGRFSGTGDSDLEFDVTFRLSEGRYAKLSSYLGSMLEDRIEIAG
jgi:hypothetical protein